MELECFVMTTYPPEIVPGRPDREWMDSFQARFPYRCLPLVMANTTGWEILCPVDFTVIWNGGPLKQDLVVTCDADPTYSLEHLVASHFTHGVLTFHTGYMFRTPPGYAVWAQGAPNHVKDGIQPLTGLVDDGLAAVSLHHELADDAAGHGQLQEGRAVLLLKVVQNKAQDDIQPVIKGLDTDPELKQQYATWAKMRNEFNESLVRRDPTPSRKRGRSSTSRARSRRRMARWWRMTAATSTAAASRRRRLSVRRNRPW